MNLTIEKQFEVSVQCDQCGCGDMCSLPTRRMALDDLKSAGWTIIRHRDKTATVLCRVCVKQALRAKEAKKQAVAAIRVKQLELQREREAIKAGKLEPQADNPAQDANDDAQEPQEDQPGA